MLFFETNVFNFSLCFNAEVFYQNTAVIQLMKSFGTSNPLVSTVF